MNKVLAALMLAELDDDLKEAVGSYPNGSANPMDVTAAGRIQLIRNLKVIDYRVTQLDQEGIATWEKRW